MILKRFSLLCVLLDVLSDVWEWVSGNVSLNVWIIDVCDDVMIDSLTTVTVDVGADMLAEFVVTIDLERVVPLPYAVDVLTDVWAGVSINVDVSITARVDFMVDVVIDSLARVFADSIASALTDVGVDMWTDVSVNVVAAVVTVSEFTTPSSLEV